MDFLPVVIYEKSIIESSSDNQIVTEIFLVPTYPLPARSRDPKVSHNAVRNPS
jgi:hypothetical protein